MSFTPNLSGAALGQVSNVYSPYASTFGSPSAILAYDQSVLSQYPSVVNLPERLYPETLPYPYPYNNANTWSGWYGKGYERAGRFWTPYYNVASSALGTVTGKLAANALQWTLNSNDPCGLSDKAEEHVRNVSDYLRDDTPCDYNHGHAFGGCCGRCSCGCVAPMTHPIPLPIPAPGAGSLPLPPHSTYPLPPPPPHTYYHSTYPPPPEVWRTRSCCHNPCGTCACNHPPCGNRTAGRPCCPTNRCGRGDDECCGLAELEGIFQGLEADMCGCGGGSCSSFSPGSLLGIHKLVHRLAEENKRNGERYCGGCDCSCCGCRRSRGRGLF